MNLSLSFMRIFFLIISMFFFSVFASNLSYDGINNQTAIGIGLLVGAIFAGLCIGLELLFKQFSLRAFVIAALGLFWGYIMSVAILFTLGLVLESLSVQLPPDILNFLKVGIILFSAYFGMTLTARASEEYSFTLPFISFKGSSPKRRNILLDASMLSDPRLIDLIHSGLLDQQLILPRFAIKELHTLAESADESTKTKAKKSLETVKKLELSKEIDLRIVETDFPEIKDPHSKLTNIARQLEANILTSEINKIQQSELDGLKVININFLSQALKPLTTAGEQILIKIQRFGKEPRQGIGYLDDGTMVVVNGGAEFIGETIKAIVLSVKSTSSGRMIFCNALEESLLGNEKSSMFSHESELPSLESFNP